jgi:F-type H+-transporting ATPase subunit delta
VEYSGGIQASLAGRYATALFALARDERKIEEVDASLAAIRTALAESDDFRALTTSPLISRGDAVRATLASADAIGVDPLTHNFLGVLAQNRRLSQLPGVIKAFNTLRAHHRGEITADVTSARPLDDGQIAALKANLRSRVGRDIAVELNTDPEILGGLVVKIGSQMIDGSIRNKLNALTQAMKG